MNEHILAYFITWTVYGTFLPGDLRGWMKRDHGPQLPRPLLARWHHDRLKHSIELLELVDRQCVKDAMVEISDFRAWKLWIANPRMAHVHCVVSASSYPGDRVRDQMKAKATKELRALDKRFCERPVWTRGGDYQPVYTEDDLERVILYAGEGQDRKWADDV